MKKISLLLFLSIALISCNQPKKVDSDSKKEDVIKVEVQKEETHEVDETLRLNDGEFWIANPETTQGVLKMKAIMNDFSGGKTAEDYATLTATLGEQFGDIFAKCTMKGDAHNQLHNFLKPMLPLFNDMKSDDVETCKKSFTTLKKHLSQYELFFK